MLSTDWAWWIVSRTHTDAKHMHTRKHINAEFGLCLFFSSLSLSDTHTHTHTHTPSWVWLTQSISVWADMWAFSVCRLIPHQVNLRSPLLWVKWSQLPRGDALGGSQDNFKTRHVLFLRCMSLSHLRYISCQVALSRTSVLNAAKRGRREEEREPECTIIFSGSQ